MNGSKYSFTFNTLIKPTILKTVSKIFTSEFKDRGSKFIGYIFPSKTEEEFNHHLQSLKSDLWDASHHCYGYRIQPTDTIEFSSDDGEPSGTAGLPILNHLRSSELIDVGSVVVRYFGGTKLGKSGLIEAYGKSAQLAINSAKLREIKLVQFIEVNYPYTHENVIGKLILNFGLIEQKAEYLTDVTKLFACPLENIVRTKKELQAIKHLSIKSQMLHKSYIYL